MTVTLRKHITDTGNMFITHMYDLVNLISNFRVSR